MNKTKIKEILNQTEELLIDSRAAVVLNLNNEGYVTIISEGQVQDIVFLNANLDLFLKEILSGRQAKNQKPELVK